MGEGDVSGGSVLMNWAGGINFQRVTIWTDQQSLRHWVTEHVKASPGPRGRTAPWHQVLPQYRLTIQYVPGGNNQIADAMLRYALPPPMEGATMCPSMGCCSLVWK